jgi:hypothetical protein
MEFVFFINRCNKYYTLQSHGKFLTRAAQIKWLKNAAVSSEISLHCDSKWELHFSFSTHIRHKQSNE